MKTVLNIIKEEIVNMETITEENLNKIFKKYNLDEDVQKSITSYLLNNNQESKDNDEEPTKEELENIESEDSLDDTLEIEDGFKGKDNTYYTDDPIKAYLNEIGKYEVLSDEEEKEVFSQIRDIRAKIKNARTEEEKEELDEKLLELVKYTSIHNLRLVVSIAKKHTNRGVDFLDLIQEGNLGLMKAIEKFDVDKGFKFSTYAHWWIKQSVTRSIADKSRTIRIPVHTFEQVSKFLRVSKLLEQDLKRPPTDEELVEELDLPIERIRELKVFSQTPVSLYTPIGEEEDTTLMDFIEDDAESLEDQVDQTMLRNFLQKFVDGKLEDENIYTRSDKTDAGKFSNRELTVLKLRFGFGEDNIPHTLEEVAKELVSPTSPDGVTRERVRQIEAKALRKLRSRNNAVGKHIRDYSDSPKLF